MLLKTINFINRMNRQSKSFLFMVNDTIVIIGSLFLAYSLRYGQIVPLETIVKIWPIFPFMVACGLLASWMLGIHKIKLKSFDLQAVQRIVLCALALMLSAMSVSFLFRLSAPRSVPVIFSILYFFGALFSRINSIFILQQLNQIGQKRIPVLIYGAGAAGIQLATGLKQSKEVKPVAFLDDNRLLRNLIIYGLAVHSPENIESLIKRKKIERILIAIPSLSVDSKTEILKKLAYLPCAIQIMPSHIDLINGKHISESLVPVKPEDLLGRNSFEVDFPNINVTYKEKNILLSGAGGSIGQELCHQVIKYSPSKLVLLDISEYALYTAEKIMRPIADRLGVELVPVLGSVCDESAIEALFNLHNIEVVLHTAAYKHVPLVERNEVAGLYNNVIGTHVIAAQALKSDVETFTLISTDKAVRPTNIMGACKRLAELVIQDFDKKSKKTKFSMVRFGNVLGSSGSVIPLFQDQISKGGPITLTHQDVTRYFMSISEAAYLVIVAGSFATGGEVFVLDMGESVKIKDLASRMIEKSGLTVKDENNPQGDIEIITTGLRPGEKLYEELLIDAKTLNTPHPKILRAEESSLTPKEVEKMIKEIKLAINQTDPQKVRSLITYWVKGYKRAKNDDKKKQSL